MIKEGNCIVCGRAPKTIERPNGCSGCEAPEAIEEVPIEEEEEVILEEEEAEEEVAKEEEYSDEEAYFEELPVKELKKLCKEGDLSTKGKKADLVARLLE